MRKRLFDTPWGMKVSEKAIREIDRRLSKAPDLKPTWKQVDSKPDVRSDRVEVSVVSCETVDLDNEVVLIDTVDTELFLQHPRVFWDHDYSTPPLGSCLWIRPDVRDNVPVLLAATKYREGNPLADDVWDCITSEPCLLPHKSIGFLSNKRAPTKDELQAHPDWKGATICYDVLLLEYSVVGIPANFDCLVQHVGDESELKKRLPQAPIRPVARKQLPSIDTGKALNKQLLTRLDAIDVDEIVRATVSKYKRLG